MKTLIPSNVNNAGMIFFALILLSAGSFCVAQSASPLGQQAAGDFAITQVGPHSRVWGNSAGQSVTEISTGMNFWNGQQWTPSNPSFQVSADGTAFVASQIQDPTRLAANLNCVGAVTVTTPDNVTLRSTPIAIGLYDAASGKSVIVATLTNCTGVLTDPQDVVYDRAFVGGGFAASVVYSLPDTASFHQDIVFVGFDPTFNPTNWGFAAASTSTLQIQIFTEFYDPVQPQMLTNLIASEQDPNIRANLDSPDLYDYTLDFGHYVFGPGQAYATTPNGALSATVRVMKDFVTSEGRSFLVESVPYLTLAAGLQALPAVAINAKSFSHPAAAKRNMLAAASIPSLKSKKQGSVQKIIPGKKVAITIARPHGVTVDYIVTVSSINEPKLYTADTTYFVSGNVVESSPVTMESAVFKYPKGLTGYIEVENTLTLATTNYRPAIFTSADDNTAGATLSTAIWSGYTGNPGTNRYGNAALWLNTTANIALNNLRFCYLNSAIEISVDTTSGQIVSLSHSQMVDSTAGIYLSSGSSGNALTFNANNCLMANVLEPFDDQTNFNSVILTGNACNCTIDTCSQLFTAGAKALSGSFNFTNSILSGVASKASGMIVSPTGGYNGFYNNGTGIAFGSPQTIVGSNPYQSAGGGNYYLPSDSPFLTIGTSNVGVSLLSQLQAKTLIAPLVLTNLFTNNTMLTPVAQRDTAGTALGFHYDPIDYISACAVSNATLLLTNGVALAYYDNLGIWLLDNSQLVSQGTPNYRNYLAYYAQVQEQPTNLWGVTNAVAQSLPIAPWPTNSANKPFIDLRLTTICAPTGETNLLNTSDSNQVISGLTLQDCEIYGSGANWLMNESNNTPVIGFTNNVFYRVPFAVSNNATITCYNNLFYGTTNINSFTVAIRHRTGTSSNTNENNVFDGVTASLDGTLDHNAYLHGGTNTSIQASDIVTNLTWVVGPLGAYYQPSNSPLLTNGSTYATNLGLYHYTVLTSESVEGTNIVSRGYHYVALGSNGLPLDNNGDGIPDYLEDANGNGLVDSGEIGWNVPGDLGLTVIITQPVNNSTIP